MSRPIIRNVSPPLRLATVLTTIGYPPPVTKRRGLRDRFPHMLLSPTIVPPSETEGITAGPEQLLPTGAFPIALTETGNHIWFAWTLWVSILSGIHESPFRASSMAGYFDRKNGYAYFDRPLCSNKLFGQNVCPFSEDIQIGHTERTCRSPGSRDILEVQWAGIACQDTLSLHSGRPACPGTVCLSNMQGQNGRSSRTIIFMTKRNVPIQK